ncbi:hypothetical protein K280104A7_04800 [Candidatus Bariatricus faecipullorum]
MKIETRKLLEKCSAGCQMALDSMAQMQDLVEDEKLAQLIQTYQVKHEHIVPGTGSYMRFWNPSSVSV